MSDFFRGWRRKSGSLFLALALLFTASWVRGLYEVDQIHFFRDSQTLHTLLSSPLGLGWTRIRETTTVPLFNGFIDRLSWQTMHSTNSNMAYQSNWSDTRWGFHWLGFRSITYWMDSPPSLLEQRIWIIPHWSVVFPLTLLSAWLLLVKQSPKNVGQKS